MSRKGFTLVELLIGMSLFTIILVAGVEFFRHAGALFFKLKDAEEDSQAVYSALDRIRLDLVRGGRGLKEAMDLGLVTAVEAGPEKLTILSTEGARTLGQDLGPGGGRAVLDSTEGFKKGGGVCFLEGSRGEVRNVAAVEGATLILDLPAEAGYSAGACRVLPIESVSYYLGTLDRVVRRRVNSSPAQPLIEDVEDFRFSFDVPSNLASVALVLAPHKERRYGIQVFPKNAGLSPRQ
jgi:prepilin-type N-terminal cleavage/methylation domain-containing protein